MLYKPILERINSNRVLYKDFEHIGELISRLHIWSSYISTKYLATNEVTINFDIFGSFMEDRIGSNMFCNLISQNNGSRVGVENPISCRECCNHVNLLAVWVIALYLAFVLECAIAISSLLFQVTKFPLANV